MTHQFYDGVSYTSTSNIIWYKIPTKLIEQNNYLLVFKYYWNDISLDIHKEGDIITVTVQIQLNKKETYPADSYTSLWIQSDKSDEYGPSYSTKIDQKMQNNSYVHSKTIVNLNKELYIAFYIYL